MTASDEIDDMISDSAQEVGRRVQNQCSQEKRVKIPGLDTQASEHT
jgi:hypothetical protein